MRYQTFSTRSRAALALFLLAMFMITNAASQEKVLHSFGHGTDGINPHAGLIFDADGNLYGTTELGGIHDSGTVFELSPKEGGGWTGEVLHSFGHGNDGAYPYAGLIFDADGNLFGTTFGGGIHETGTVFELTPNGGGSWTEKVLHSFNNNGTDGSCSPGWPGFRRRRQSLRYHLLWRHPQFWDGVRINAQSGWRLEREGAA